MAYFLVEILDTLRGVLTVIPVDPSEPEARKDIWELHTNGVASKELSVVGLILKNPSRDEITYALGFDFQVSNNEFECKTLLVGLRLTQEVGAKHLSSFSHSFLVTNHVKSFKIHQIPWGEHKS